MTRPDIAHAVQQVCLYMHDPWQPHMALLKRICATYVARRRTAFFSARPPTAPLRCTLMQIRAAAPTPGDPPPASASTSATPSSRGRWNANQRYRAPVPRPNTERWQM
jgi:hypothetical protein